MGALLVLTVLTQLSTPPLVDGDAPSTPAPAPPPAPSPAQRPDAGPSTPPVFGSDVPVEPAPAPRPTPVAEPERPTALFFSPISLFATHLAFELERGISRSISVFAAVGGSLVPQAGVDLGLRLYVGEGVLDGAFLAAQGSVFYFAPSQSLLAGPGAMFGYVFRPRGIVALSIGAGLQVWHEVTGNPSITAYGIQPNTPVIVFPGFQRPGAGNWAPQPMVRVTVGPTF